jgi:hypothetical protein
MRRPVKWIHRIVAVQLFLTKWDIYTHILYVYIHIEYHIVCGWIILRWLLEK